MKPGMKQYERAAADIASRVRKLLADCAPTIQTKYQLHDELLKLATYSGVGVVAAECAKGIEGMEEFTVWDGLRLIEASKAAAETKA